MRDETSHDAIKRVAAEILISAMERLEISQRAIVFAAVALETPMSALTRQFKMTEDQVREEIEEGLQVLRTAEGVEDLAGIRRLGDLINFFDHIHRLNLERWFCHRCGNLQVPKPTGRPRITCSNECRYRMNRDRRLGETPPEPF
ncbi:hypothetical protein [Herbidospora cretacea]|uniref:hypothetical protein n=1 Tax=Herbidospora cretacea TaxID=28444 RepID=UPI0004C334B1|nr:hypothetical protein [Herbidospora cretacea]